MAEETSIAWTDHTFNPFIGCTKVSPGCDNCYAETLNHRWGHDNWGKGKVRRLTSDSNWREPLRWDRVAAKAAVRANVFCGSLCDVMDDEAPAGARDRLWELIDSTPNLFWQLLTKRPQRYMRYLPEKGFKHGNVILMTTVESQEFYEPRIKALNNARQLMDMRTDLNGGGGGPMQIGVSYEPALGPLSLRDYFGMRPHWLIFGGETGAGRRPMEMDWFTNIKRECEEYGIRFFAKQFSAQTPKQAAALIPAEMLVRQFPEGGR
jgi:protein gp37